MSTHLEAARAALARAAEHMNRAENLLSIAQEAFGTPLDTSSVYVCVCCESVSYRPVAGGREDEPLCVICGSAGCAPSLDSVQCRR